MNLTDLIGAIPSVHLQQLEDAPFDITYVFPAKDFGAAANWTEVIESPPGFRGVVRAITMYDVTEIFNEPTTPAYVYVGLSGDIDAFVLSASLGADVHYPAECDDSRDRCRSDWCFTDRYRYDRGHNSIFQMSELMRAIEQHMQQAAVIRESEGIKSLLAHSQDTLNTGKVLTHPDGKQTTIFTMGVQDERLNNGKETIIPSFWSGKVVDRETSIQNALRSGKKWPSALRSKQ